MTNTPPPPLISGVLLPRPPVRAIVDGLARPMSQIPAFPRAENLHIATLLGSPQDIKPLIAAAAGVKSQFNGVKSSHRPSHRLRFTHSAIS